MPKLTKKGYVRIWSAKDKRLRMEHDLVWEKHYGAIPAGYQIHHKDGNKTNNDISNLQLVSTLEHKRLHSGCRINSNGEWEKPCRVCGEFKPATKEHWYYSKAGWITGNTCRKCRVKQVLADRRVRIANGWIRKDYRNRNNSIQLNYAGNTSI